MGGMSDGEIDVIVSRCDDSPLSIIPRTESVSWGIATKLGANETHDSDTAYALCYHRWRWFAGAPREWRCQFESIVQGRLHWHLWEYWERNGITPITEDTPWEEADELIDARETVTGALWHDGGNLVELKQRAVDLRNAGEAECRENDLRCDHHQREWILDLILEDIVLEVEAQHVDDEYDSDESCEFGDPDPYDEFIADPDLSRYEDGYEDSATAIEARHRHHLDPCGGRRHGQPLSALLGHDSDVDPMDVGGARPPLADTGPTPVQSMF